MVPGALLIHGGLRVATIVHDRAVVRRLLNSGSLPDILHGRLVYDSERDNGASDAEGDCAVDKDDLDAENDSAMG